VVTGATGNVGTAVVRELLEETAVEQVVAVARRRPAGWPELASDRVSWQAADVATDDLVAVFREADAVVHLAWLFQPQRDPDTTWVANVVGSKRVMSAAAEAGVGTLVVASSVGAYSPRESLDPVEESYPTDGVPTAPYSREKAYVERLLDGFEAAHPEMRVARLRPAFIFQRESATEQRRLFGGPFVPERLVTRLRVPVLPDPGADGDWGGLHFQALHAGDVARAYRLAVTRPVTGAFNIAADPVIDLELLAEVYGVRRIRVPYRPVRALVGAAWHARLVPVAPAMLDLVTSMPVMSTRRAREELGWHAEVDGVAAIRELLAGLRHGDDKPTPPLAAETSGTLRGDELGGGIGSRP